jgi:hypothetical protein
VPSFDPDDFNRPDWVLFQDGWVHLFWRPAVLATSVARFRALGYLVHEFDGGTWTTLDSFHSGIASALGFPAYYGRNLSALRDCMRDVAGFEYGSDSASEGTILVVSGFDAFRACQPDAAEPFVDIVALTAQQAALYGHRMLLLLQSNDPEIRLPAVGGRVPEWNPDEWLNSSRAPG